MHAEMTCIQAACAALQTHDLSDCELYTTCEPCPMCWGAVQWARFPKIHIGVDRNTAAKYGFDDKVFYEEIDAKAGSYGIRRYGYMNDSSAFQAKGGSKVIPEAKLVHKNMVEVYDGILQEDVASLFKNSLVNRTFRRRFSGASGSLQEAHSAVFARQTGSPGPRLPPPGKSPGEHERFMKLAIAAAEQGASRGQSKEREPFGAVIVRNGVVLAEAHNTVLQSRDATATAEVNAIRMAARKLGTYSLEGCDLYSTTHPDLMSLGAILWARIARVYCGVTQQLAAQCGHEEGLMHFKDLLEQGPDSRATVVVEGVAAAQCEAVFQQWSDLNGVIY